MPVLDLVALGKAVAKYAFFLGFIAFIAGLASLLGDMILSLWTIVSTSVDAAGNALNGSGGSGSLSCFYYFLHGLGVDTSLGSFIVSASGLLLIWAGAVLQIIIYQVGIFGKNLLVQALS